ncbi:hypothetical protein HXX76_016170 [Chlamydomonas incerta]|uniref:Uncharacterized protein n=1 Tax=Chlamydomonas incerta TaxID=51695 RepID=A0A835SLN0_CHLIN|nr:hypothetical protein HXX76_016170 [Chlamydomonas incerta]|eukprot:KAG2422256.1 hypothetical protein HXX76_016170 [Chlamydomonas incerta]
MRAPPAGLGVGSATGAGGAPTPPALDELGQLKEILKELKEKLNERFDEVNEGLEEVNEGLEELREEIKAIKLCTSIIEITPSKCSSGVRQRIESAVGVRWEYKASTHAPCCYKGCEPWSAPFKFCWGSRSEDAQETIVAAVKCLENMVPAGVKVVPVQSVNWLSATVPCGTSNVLIKPARTDYLYVLEAAWNDCVEKFGANLKDGCKLEVTSGSTADALLSMVDSVIGLYEAKTETALSSNQQQPRVQALLQYMAINNMLQWPAIDVVVVYGDFNRHHVVHAGRNDTGELKQSIHVAVPCKLSAVEEHTPAVDDVSPQSVMLGFIRALLERRATQASTGIASHRDGEASSSEGGATGHSGRGASGSGGGGASHCDGEASSSEGGATGHSGRGASGSGAGGASHRDGEASSSEGGATGHSGRGASGSGAGAASHRDGEASSSEGGATGHSGRGASGSGAGGASHRDGEASSSEGGATGHSGRGASGSGGGGASHCDGEASSSEGGATGHSGRGASGSGAGGASHRDGEASSSEGGATGHSGRGASGSGAGGASHCDGEASSSEGGATGHSGRAASGSGAGAASHRDGDASSSEGGAGNRCHQGGAPSGGGGAASNHDACSGTVAGNSCAEWPRSSIAEGQFDGDEGLMEAARENAYAQLWVSVVRTPEAYKLLGLTEPPKSITPPSREECLARFRPL